MPSPAVLKALVIALGVAVAGALVAVVYGIVRTVPEVIAPAGEPPAVASETMLRQPAGSALVGVTSTGSRLHIAVTGGGLPDRIITVDSTTGVTIGTIWLSDPR